MRLRTTFIVAFLLLGLTGSPAWAHKRVAVLIGNSAYQNVARLVGPAHDAAAISDLLKKAGFDAVELNRDLGTASMKRALEELAGKSRDADIAVVYFAGHSIEADGVNYLAPVDVSPDAPGEAIPLERVLQSVEPAKQLRLILLDACHGNPLVRGTSRSAGCLPPRQFAGIASDRPNTVVVFAAKAGSTTHDDGGSPFAAALLKHLTTPGLDLQQALARVRDEVKKATAGAQEPFIVGSLSAPNLALVSRAAAPATQGTATSSGAAEGSSAKQQREDPAKVDALDRVRIAMEVATAERIARDRADAEARAAKAREQAEAKESIRGERDAGRQVAALPAGTGGITQRELNRSLQIELRRVGCQTAPANEEWTAASRRSLELFNKHTGLKLEIKLASLDALDAVKGRQARVCP
jgi:uncharacterized caspase-like protein